MMGNVKSFMVILLSIATMASGAEVISIDINNYGNDVAYSGEAAVPGATEWIVYYGGWGEPVGSPRSAGLAETGTIQASTYAEQVWLGDAGGHQYVTGAGNGLLDDGFEPNSPGLEPYYLDFIGSDLFGDSGNDAYGGTFDVYVYGDSAGSFYLTDANNILIAGPTAVTGTTSDFVEGENYVFFSNISIADANSVRLWYTNELNGIQLISTKQTPKFINPDSSDPNDYTIDARNYDVAYDTNAREAENTFYGPDFGDAVGYLDNNEYMEYDIEVDAVGKGEYNLTVLIDDQFGTTTLDIYIDGVYLGSVSATGGPLETDPPVSLKLLEGTHTLRWQSTGNQGGNIYDIILTYVGPIVFEDCQEVIDYGLNSPGDLTGDCRVNLEDLALVLVDWAACYDPEPGQCN